MKIKFEDNRYIFCEDNRESHREAHRESFTDGLNSTHVI